jgi:hypothetical protein
LRAEEFTTEARIGVDQSYAGGPFEARIRFDRRWALIEAAIREGFTRGGEFTDVRIVLL